MPFGTLAAKAAGAPANLMPPMPTTGQAPAPLPQMMPPGGPSMPAGAAPTAPTGLPAFPGASDPTAPPYTVKTQADGSLAIVWPSPDGDPAKDIISQVMPAPKIPPAMQPPKVAQA